MRTWRSLGVLAVLLVACAPKSPMDVGSRADYVDEGSTSTSSYEGQAPKIEMDKRGDRWFVAVFQGRQPSSGFRARFTVPAPGNVTLTVITSPAHTISFPFGADAIYLYDQDDQQRAELVRH